MCHLTPVPYRLVVLKTIQGDKINTSSDFYIKLIVFWFNNELVVLLIILSAKLQEELN